MLKKKNIASIPYSLDNTLLKIYFWYFYDSALHNVCIIKYDVHIERCMPCWGGSFIAELPDHWFLSCCRPRAPRARGQMRRSSFASGRFTNEHSNPLHRPHQQLLKESNFSQICLILSFGPSEENSIQLEGKDICNGWLSRSGTYSNICNIPILPIILIWFLWPFQMYISFKVFITAPDSGRKLVQFSISDVEVLYDLPMK